MKNKRGFAGMLISIIIAIAIIVVLAIWWQKMSSNKLEDATRKAAEDAGVKLDSHSSTPQGEVDAVRDMMNKIQDKKNAEIENELKK